MEPRSVPAGRDTCEQHSASSTTACVKHTAGRPHRPCDRPWRHGGSRPLPRCRPRFRRDCRVRSLICGARPFRPAGHRPSGPAQCLLGFRPGGDAGPRRFRRRVFRPSRCRPHSGSVRWRCCPLPGLRNGLERWRFPVPGCPGAGLLLRHCCRRCVRCLPVRCPRLPHAGGWDRPRRRACDRLGGDCRVDPDRVGPPCLRNSCLPCCDGFCPPCATHNMHVQRTTERERKRQVPCPAEVCLLPGREGAFHAHPGAGWPGTGEGAPRRTAYPGPPPMLACTSSSTERLPAALASGRKAAQP